MEKGDHVVVTNGKNKYNEGEVIRVMPQSVELKLQQSNKLVLVRKTSVKQKSSQPADNTTALEGVDVGGRVNTLDSLILALDRLSLTKEERI
jgi:ribosomal protein L24